MLDLAFLPYVVSRNLEDRAQVGPSAPQLVEHYIHDMAEWFEINTKYDGSYSYHTSLVQPGSGELLHGNARFNFTGRMFFRDREKSLLVTQLLSPANQCEAKQDA
jgi:hypothetical protein